jgi:hypothetical protein
MLLNVSGILCIASSLLWSMAMHSNIVWNSIVTTAIIAILFQQWVRSRLEFKHSVKLNDDEGAHYVELQKFLSRNNLMDYMGNIYDQVDDLSLLHQLVVECDASVSDISEIFTVSLSTAWRIKNAVTNDKDHEQDSINCCYHTRSEHS